MKVTIIAPNAYPLIKRNNKSSVAGGAEAQLATIGFALSELGHDIDFIVDDFGQERLERIDKVRIWKVALKYMGGRKYLIVPAWVSFVITLFRTNADCYVIKIPRNLLLPLGAFCRLTRKKLVFIGQSDSDINKNFIRRQEGQVSYWFFLTGIRWVDLIVAQNREQQQGFEKTYGKISVMVKSILTLTSESDVGKEPYVLWVGKAVENKRPDLFLSLASRLPQYRFVMIMAPSLRAGHNVLIEGWQEIPNLHYVGFVPFSEIAPYYAKSSLFVSTSGREGFPNTFLQAWQFGTPVISLDVDPDGVISEHELGRCVETFDELCDAVIEFMENEKLRSRAGENAMAYTSRYHSRDRVVSEYEEIFRNLISSRK